MDVVVHSTEIDDLKQRVKDQFGSEREGLVEEITKLETLLAGKREALRYLDRITGNSPQANGHKNRKGKNGRVLSIPHVVEDTYAPAALKLFQKEPERQF